MKFTAPSVQLKAFTCPHCQAFSNMQTSWLYGPGGVRRDYLIKKCQHCDQESLWAVTTTVAMEGSLLPAQGTMLLPRTQMAVAPEPSMPEDVKRDYVEAAQIFQDSPRASAALLRLGLQKLCKALGEDGKHIDKDIRSLAEKNTLPPLVIKVADTLRIAGNQAVHPGEMSEEDFDHVAAKLFELLNFMVRKAIDEPRELQELYQMVPEAARKAAESRDAKAARPAP